ncbi:MAG: hypothetical protein KUG78_05070 [Kangiellaceae bacterium]|nr:hypothetical protein [Kangiellaceae bacterium]
MRNSRSNIVLLLSVISCCNLGLSCDAKAEVNVEQLDSLTNVMARVTKVSKKIQSLNSGQVLAGFSRDIAQKNSLETSKILVAAGENINYPAILKAEFDQSVDNALTLAEDIIDTTNNTVQSAACHKALDKIRVSLKRVKQSLQVASALSVSLAKTRAEAYIALTNVMPLNMIIAKLGMTKISVCRVK